MAVNDPNTMSPIVTSACPRLTSDAARITSTELLVLLDPPQAKRRGRIVGLALRFVPKAGDAALGLSPAIV